jgi:hypothetical protein
VTQVGEGHEGDNYPVMTFGAPVVGEILADRYRLEEHINDDAAGRQVWRGVDIILRRPVAVVLRYPGGESAAEMLSAAVAASRVTHSHLVGVYDAIDEGERAYVVREWVDGAALRDYVAQAPLDPGRATTVGHAVASAVAAVHATGMVHGNIHPGTVLIGNDGRVVLADARADDAVTPETDIRAVGAILYFALTGHWPQAELATQHSRNLPDGMRDHNGMLAPPRQVRAGVPAYLDELIADLLDSRLALPSAEVLAAELGRLDAEAEVEAAFDAPYYEESPLGFGAVGPAETTRPGSGKKVAVGIAALLLVAAAGLLLGMRFMQFTGADNKAEATETAAPTAAAPSQAGGGGGETETVKLNPNQIRVVDPGGTRSELDGIERVVDGNPETMWKTERYNNRPDFGGLKPGMGILVSLGSAQKVSVEVLLSAPGVSAELRVGSADPGATKAGDSQILQTYKRVGEAVDNYNGTNMVFPVEEAAQYLLVWITQMPKVDDSHYQIGIQEIIIHAR